MARTKVSVDWPLVISALLLSLYGIAIVYSAGQTDIPTYVGRAWKMQFAWFGVGLIGAYFISRSSVRMLEWMAAPLYVLTCLLLLALVFIGKGAGTAEPT